MTPALSAAIGPVMPTLTGGGGDVATTLAFPDLNPLGWLGAQAVGVAADAWKSAMIGLWSGGLWMLQLAFRVIDAFATPDVTTAGPLKSALPITLWLGVTVGVLVMTVQLASALFRHDGAGLGRVLLGLAQFGVVWIGYLTVAGLLITAAGALTQGVLSSMLGVSSWADFALGESWPREISDATAATVLGVSALLLLIPAAFGYLMVMLVREAALLILLATAPISAAGLMSDTNKVWFWKTLRWFIASLLIAPAAALILGIGVQISAGVVAGAGTDTVAATGTAVVGCVLVAVGAICPMTLFKLLAFVEPGTASGAALRQSMSDAGGVGALLGGGKAAGGSQQASSAATADDGQGRSAGEAAAETQTGSRMASAMGALGAVGAGIAAGVKVATKAADLASDVLGSGGVGDPGYSSGFADNAARRQNGGGGGLGGRQGGSEGGGASTDGAPATDPGGGASPDGGSSAPPPAAPMGPAPGGPGGSPAGGGSPVGGPGGAGAASGGAGAGAAEVAVVAL